jgi:hypothetical protein
MSSHCNTTPYYFILNYTTPYYSILNYTVLINIKRLGDGGALYLSRDNQYIEVIDCEFSNNTALGLIDEQMALGGALCLHSKNHHVTLTGTLFLNNTAMRGGALGIYDSNLFTELYRCMFHGNAAAINGGGMYMVFDNTDMKIEECSFWDNNAEYGESFVT